MMKFSKRDVDGRISYEVVTGHKCKHPILEIVEYVLFRTAVDKNERHKADEYWYEGVFLGVETSTKLYKCSHHNVKRNPEEHAYMDRCMNDIKTTIWDYQQAGASTNSPGKDSQNNGEGRDVRFGSGNTEAQHGRDFVPEASE